MSDQWLKLSNEVYRKELLPVGKYRKDSEDLDFEITNEFLTGMKASFDGMLGSGVAVPLVQTHDGQSSFGTIKDVILDKNADGIDSSFVDIAFADEKSKNEALKNDVSAFIPPEFVDGRGNAWKRPLRHVAITPYPVIPGLGKWSAIAASHCSLVMNDQDQVPQAEERKKAMLETLAKSLRLSFGESDSQEQREDAVCAAVARLAGQSLELADQLKTTKRALRLAEDSAPEPPVKLPDAVITQIGKARRTEIENLVLSEKISPAVAKDLIAEHCDTENVTLSLSHNDDHFDKLIGVLTKNEPLKNVGRESIKLSHDGDADDSIMVKEARKRAEAAKSA